MYLKSKIKIFTILKYDKFHFLGNNNSLNYIFPGKNFTVKSHLRYKNF